MESLLLDIFKGRFEEHFVQDGLDQCCSTFLCSRLDGQCLASGAGVAWPHPAAWRGARIQPCRGQPQHGGWGSGGVWGGMTQP